MNQHGLPLIATESCRRQKLHRSVSHQYVPTIGVMTFRDGFVVRPKANRIFRREINGGQPRDAIFDFNHRHGFGHAIFDALHSVNAIYCPKGLWPNHGKKVSLGCLQITGRAVEHLRTLIPQEPIIGAIPGFIEAIFVGNFGNFQKRQEQRSPTMPSFSIRTDNIRWWQRAVPFVVETLREAKLLEVVLALRSLRRRFVEHRLRTKQKRQAQHGKQCECQRFPTMISHDRFY